MREPDHRRFVRAVHRRAVAVRIAETLIATGTPAALAAAPVVVALRCVGRPVAPAVVATAAAALVAASIRLVRRPPTSLTVATAVDRWFGWGDLIPTAMAMPACAGDFAAAVRASADQRCAAHRPSEVPVARLPWWWWASAVTAAALLATAAAWPAPPIGPVGRGDGTLAAVLASDPEVIVRPPPSSVSPARVVRAAPPNPSESSEQPSAQMPDETPTMGPPGDGGHAALTAAGAGRGSSHQVKPPRLPPQRPVAVVGSADDRGSNVLGGGMATGRRPNGTDAAVGAVADAQLPAKRTLSTSAVVAANAALATPIQTRLPCRPAIATWSASTSTPTRMTAGSDELIRRAATAQKRKKPRPSRGSCNWGTRIRT